MILFLQRKTKPRGRLLLIGMLYVMNFKAGHNKFLIMRHLFILFIAVIAFNCTPRLSPDAGWGNQRWVVAEMKGVPVQQSGSRKDAFIRFEIADKRFTGNGGCNQINGNYNLDKNEIRFTEVISTKMSCNDIEFENTFLNILNSVDRYEVSGNDLLLKRKREVVLVLKTQ